MEIRSQQVFECLYIKPKAMILSTCLARPKKIAGDAMTLSGAAVDPALAPQCEGFYHAGFCRPTSAAGGKGAVNRCLCKGAPLSSWCGLSMADKAGDFMIAHICNAVKLLGRSDDSKPFRTSSGASQSLPGNKTDSAVVPSRASQGQLASLA